MDASKILDGLVILVNVIVWVDIRGRLYRLEDLFMGRRAGERIKAPEI